MNIRIPRLLTDNLVPNIQAANLIEIFLISAVSSLLLIRAYLQLTGYPQLGGGDFHVAHMLWGGLFMLAALLFSFSFLNTTSKYIAAVLGGIGFGTFIDELGKFITTDNNYFFQPTVGLIYVIFVLIFFLIKYLQTYTTYSAKTYTINATEHLKEVLRQDLDAQERQQALSFLKNSPVQDKITQDLYHIIETAPYEPKKTTWFDTVSNYANVHIDRIEESKLITHIILGIYTLTVYRNAAYSIITYYYQPNKFDLLFVWSTLFVAFTVSVGLVQYLRHHHAAGLQKYYIASLISLFIVQIFLFLDNQFTALFSFIIFITTYIIIKQRLPRYKSAQT